MLSNHHRGQVRIAARNLGHQRRVGDAQVVDANDACPRIGNRLRIAHRAKAAGASGVPYPGHRSFDVVPKAIFVGQQLAERR